MYYGADGAMLHGTQVIGGQTYRFDSVTGALLLNGMELKAQIYNSNTGWLILVDTSANRVGVYRGYVNNWNEVKYWPCTSGAMSTPTVKGRLRFKDEEPLLAQDIHVGIIHNSTVIIYSTQFYINKVVNQQLLMGD